MRLDTKHILCAVNILAIMLILCIVFFPNNVLRIVLGLPVVLFFPGYALISALYPRKASLSGIERLALSFGLSIAVVPLIGLALNYTPWGIRLYPILISLFIFIMTMSFIAWYRSRRLTANEKVTVNLSFKFPSIISSWNSQTQWSKILTVILIVMVLGAIGALVYVAGLPRSSEKFTEFYVLGSEGKAENYPSIMTPGQSGNVILGIVNHESEVTEYRIEITIDGENSGEIGDISLNSGERWERMVSFSPAHTGAKQEVDFLLYKGTDVNIYESVHLWIEVK